MAVSGLRVLSYTKYTRRDRFVLAAALSFGLGDLLVPGLFTHLFDRVHHHSSGLQGLFDSITIILSTPCKQTPRNPESCVYIDQYCHVIFLVLAAGVVGVLLNLILPQEDQVEADASTSSLADLTELEDQKHA